MGILLGRGKGGRTWMGEVVAGSSSTRKEPTCNGGFGGSGLGFTGSGTGFSGSGI